jgi:hypothetical protein
LRFDTHFLTAPTRFNQFLNGLLHPWNRCLGSLTSKLHFPRSFVSRLIVSHIKCQNPDCWFCIIHLYTSPLSFLLLFTN